MFAFQVIFNLSVLIAVANCLTGVRGFKNSKLSLNGDHVKLEVADDDVSFFVMGDWGGLPDSPYRTAIELGVSDTMTKYAKSHDTKFQIALGDNFYFNGVKNADDRRFKETYEDVFKSEALMNTPWFFVLGNHDHYGNASAQITYMEKSKRWIFPNFNYTMAVQSVENPDRTFIKFLFIDTILMCGNTEHDSLDSEPRFDNLRGKQNSQDYFKALENELREISETEKVDYLIVAGHFPVWSIASHGPTKCLVDNLRPLLHKFNVSAYLSGHDHNLQHISDTYLGSEVNFIISGAANFIEDNTDHMNSIPKDSLKYFYGDASKLTNGGFCLFKATPQNLTVTYVESSGLELYQTVLKPRKF